MYKWDMPHLLTRRAALGMPIGGLACLASGPGSLAADMVERSDLQAAFDEQGVAGTFVLHHVGENRVQMVNGQRASRRFVPASTFKITNSLIALETGVVKDEDEIIPFGGQPQQVKQWARDMSMREAIAMSNVPVYQEIARRVGVERYQYWLNRLDYGNCQVGEAVDRFWLDGPLAISAVEQARFVGCLSQGSLPVSERSQRIVRSILKLEETNGRTLHGKTGWATSSSPKVGWWTGWVDDRGKLTAFSLNIDMPTIEDAPKRLAVAKAILARLGVL